MVFFDTAEPASNGYGTVASSFHMAVERESSSLVQPAALKKHTPGAGFNVERKWVITRGVLNTELPRTGQLAELWRGGAGRGQVAAPSRSEDFFEEILLNDPPDRHHRPLRIGQK